MSDIDFPDDLIALERAAWEEYQAGRLTVATATAVHEGIVEYVAREDVDATRLEVEMGLKRIVRHPAAEG
ncbi:hypothetical protein [Streptomyces violaceus]|uniref:Uncharacterized protein n=1 Tax=Streptomyces violaceus TaxID=1936 RepID=A0ABZ1NKR8_STRVL